MLTAFADSRVRYPVVGGHAVGVHARPRTTKDLDIWLDAAPENIARACAALRAFGVPEALGEDLRTASPDEIVWMGRPPARVDLLMTIPGVAFRPGSPSTHLGLSLQPTRPSSVQSATSARAASGVMKSPRSAGASGRVSTPLPWAFTPISATVSPVLSLNLYTW